MKEIYGASEEHNAEKLYIGYVAKVDLDRHNTLFGFIEHVPNNIFFMNLITPIWTVPIQEKKSVIK